MNVHYWSRSLLALGVLCLAATASVAGERSLHGGAVSIEVPDAWRMQLDEPRGTGHVLVYEVPFAATDQTPHVAQLVLTTARNSNLVPVMDYARGIFREESARPGFVVVASSADSTSCLSVLSTGGDKGARYAIVDRFSSSAEWLARVRIAFPLLKQAPRSWYDGAIPDFNSALASFDECGTSGSGVSELRLRQGILELVPRREGGVVRPIDDPALRSPFPEGQQGLVLYTEPMASALPAAGEATDPVIQVSFTFPDGSTRATSISMTDVERLTGQRPAYMLQHWVLAALRKLDLSCETERDRRGSNSHPLAASRTGRRANGSTMRTEFARPIGSIPRRSRASPAFRSPTCRWHAERACGITREAGNR